MMTKEQLLLLKTNIDKAKTKLAELGGKRESYMEQLNTLHKCKTLEQANKKLAEYQTQIEKQEKAIKQATAELEEKYEFN